LNRFRIYTPSHQECGESAVEGEEGEVISQVIMVFLEYHHVGRCEEGFGAEGFHFLRSAIKSSMESNDLVFPAAISLSASASAFSQLNSLKYGGRDNAYLINSATASSVVGLFADFLYRSISSKISSGIFIVNSRFAIFMFLLRQNTIQLAFKSIYTKTCFKRDKTSLFMHPHTRYMLKMLIEGEDTNVVFNGKGSNRNIS